MAYIRYPGATSASISFPLTAPDGSAAAPSYSFSSSSGTGMYYSATQINWAVSGVLQLSLSATALTAVGSISGSNLSGTNTGDITLAAVGSSPSANGASLAAQVLTLQPADGTHPGLLTSGSQTIGGAKTFSSTVAASNLSGTNTGDITLAAVGSSPNANGASLSGQALNLQPADGTNPGVVSTGTQTIAGTKTFSGQLIGKGTATNDSAAAGNIGEYIESLVSSPTSVGTTNQFFDLTSISLTAGDWDVEGLVRYAANSATFTSTDLYVGIGTVTGNSGTGTIDGINTAELKGVAPINFLLASLVVPSYRVSLSGTTTYYLKGVVADYSSGTPKYLCRMSARRVR